MIKKKLDEFHYHEILDRFHILGCIIDQMFLNHPVIKKHKELKKIYNKICKQTGKGYQLTGHLSDKKK